MKQLLISLALLVCATAQANNDHIESKMICQKFAAKELKSPSTAKFESINTVAAAPDEKIANRWVSVGYVDAQNAYGAMLRSDYQCTVDKTGPNKWRLIEMYWHKKRLS